MIVWRSRIASYKKHTYTVNLAAVLMIAIPMALTSMPEPGFSHAGERRQ